MKLPTMILVYDVCASENGTITLKPRIVPQDAIRAALEQLQFIAGEEADHEQGHSDADSVLCDLLTQFGCQDVVDAFNAVTKWYS